MTALTTAYLNGLSLQALGVMGAAFVLFAGIVAACAGILMADAADAAEDRE